MSVPSLKSTIISYYKTNRFSLLTALIMVVLLFLLDMSRFQSTDNLHKKTRPLNNIDTLTLPVLTNEAFALIEKTYEKFQQDVNVLQNTKTQVMSAEQQEKQQGELVSVFVGDNQLKLKAVVSYNESPQSDTSKQAFYALIKVINLTKGDSVIQKYFQGEDVFGYQLVIEQNQQVQLIAHVDEQGNKTKRTINLRMYQKPKASPEALNKQALSNQNNIKEFSE